MLTRRASRTARLGCAHRRPGRSVLVAVGVVVVAMLVGGTGLVLVLESSLEQSVEATGRARAAEVVSRVDANGVPSTVATLSDQSRTDAVTLVLDASGAVIGSSRRSATTALSSQRPGVGQYDSVERDIDTLDEGGEWKVVTTALTSAGQTYYVQVAVPVRIQRDTVSTVAVLLLAATPLLLGGRGRRGVGARRAGPAVGGTDPYDGGRDRRPRPQRPARGPRDPRRDRRPGARR